MKHATVLDTPSEKRRKEIENSFKSEWSADDFTLMQKAINKHFLEAGILTDNKVRHFIPKLRSYTRIFECIDNVLGLAYTSSSSYAGYWICNVTALNDKYPGYHYIGFALSKENKGYAILRDNNENEIIIAL